MEPLPKLSKHASRVIARRLRTMWELLKARFAPQAEEDLARAEERHRAGTNRPRACLHQRLGNKPQLVTGCERRP